VTGMMIIIMTLVMVPIIGMPMIPHITGYLRIGLYAQYWGDMRKIATLRPSRRRRLRVCEELFVLALLFGPDYLRFRPKTQSAMACASSS
jgi:hypothetical protein